MAKKNSPIVRLLSFSLLLILTACIGIGVFVHHWLSKPVRLAAIQAENALIDQDTLAIGLIDFDKLFLPFFTFLVKIKIGSDIVKNNGLILHRLSKLEI